MDQMQAIRLLQNNDWVSQTGYGLNTDEMFYLGISLGSILGASLSLSNLPSKHSHLMWAVPM